MRDVAPKMKSIIANTSLFKMLTPRQLDLIVSKTTPMRVGSNMTIVNQGDVAEGTYWVVYGQVNIAVYNKQGGAKMLAILGPGKCFGLGEMVLGQPHQTCIKTTANSMLLHTDKEAMLAVAEENFEFSREVMTCLGRQFCGLVRDIGNYSLSSHQRLAEYLLRQTEHVPNAEIELVATKGVIASRLGVTPETLSRVFRDFIGDGLIRVNGRRITVLDWGKVTAVMA